MLGLARGSSPLQLSDSFLFGILLFGIICSRILFGILGDDSTATAVRLREYVSMPSTVDYEYADA